MCFVSEEQGVEACEQLYLTTLLQLLCLQGLRCKGLGEDFETGCTLGLDEKTRAGSSTICLRPILNIVEAFIMVVV